LNIKLLKSDTYDNTSTLKQKNIQENIGVFSCMKVHRPLVWRQVVRLIEFFKSKSLQIYDNLLKLPIFREAEYLFASEKNTFVYETISDHVVCLCQYGICG
jgi:hypothetical protein